MFSIPTAFPLPILHGMTQKFNSHIICNLLYIPLRYVSRLRWESYQDSLRWDWGWCFITARGWRCWSEAHSNLEAQMVLATTFNSGVNRTTIERTISETWGINDRTFRGKFWVGRVGSGSVLDNCGSPWRFMVGGHGGALPSVTWMRSRSEQSWRVWSVEQSIIEVLTMSALIFMARVDREVTI